MKGVKYIIPNADAAIVGAIRGHVALCAPGDSGSLAYADDLAEDPEDEEQPGDISELCECGRPVDDCASAEGADYCADRDEYVQAGCPETFEEFEAA